MPCDSMFRSYDAITIVASRLENRTLSKYCIAPYRKETSLVAQRHHFNQAWSSPYTFLEFIFSLIKVTTCISRIAWDVDLLHRTPNWLGGGTEFVSKKAIKLLKMFFQKFWTSKIAKKIGYSCFSKYHNLKTYTDFDVIFNSLKMQSINMP